MLRTRDLDALLVSSPTNIRYLTGFTGSNGLCVIRRRGGVLLTDGRYAMQVQAEAKGIRCIVARGGLAEEAASLRLLGRGERVGFESSAVSYATYRSMRALFPGVAFAPTREIVEDLRVVKSPEELRRIRAAAAISDQVFHEVLSLVYPGVREVELAAEISYRQRRHGAEEDAFPPIVVGGPRGAFPHARPGPRPLRKGELVTMDFGCTVAGYHSDLTRTVAIGRVPERAARMYRAVAEAQASAIEAARGGMGGRVLDAVAREVITRAGFGEYFNHSLGHGLGLQLHERPRVSARANDTLPAGAVITIEPGVYVPRTGGVRIEDDVLLTRAGCEVLTRAPKEFLIV